MLKKLMRRIRYSPGAVRVMEAASGITMLIFYTARFQGFCETFAVSPEGACLVIAYLCAAVWLTLRMMDSEGGR